MIVKLTETAKQRFDHLLQEHGQSVIRISVNNKGCSGHSYNLVFDDEIRRGDEVIALDHGRIVIDAASVLFLFGVEIDWQVSYLAANFTFHNPNAKSLCGCGESFSV